MIPGAVLPEFGGKVLDLTRSAGSQLVDVPQPDDKPPVRARLKYWFAEPGAEFYGPHQFGRAEWAAGVTEEAARKVFTDARNRWANGTKEGVSGHCADAVAGGKAGVSATVRRPDVLIGGTAEVSSTSYPDASTCDLAYTLRREGGTVNLPLSGTPAGRWLYIPAHTPPGRLNVSIGPFSRSVFVNAWFGTDCTDKHIVEQYLLPRSWIDAADYYRWFYVLTSSGPPETVALTWYYD